ncbi:MAG: hypothetical protein ABJA37_07430 [Ferruginibacter sp.]
MINYHLKKFRGLSNTSNGEADAGTAFYQQKDNMITATYSGGSILSGQLIVIVNENGSLNMRYQHINNKNELMTGRFISTPQILSNWRLRLHEKWQWTGGNCSKGEYVIEEFFK